LSQGEVAEILSVCEDTISGWEVRGTVPAIQQIPRITKMINYLPVAIDTSTFGGRITYYRCLNGLTPKKFGQMVTADPSTVRSWEASQNIPHKKRKQFIEHIIQSGLDNM